MNMMVANSHPGGFGAAMGLSSVVDEEKSVSLLDSIAIKEESTSTQKKYIEPQQSLDSVNDHGGNEQDQ